MATKRKRIPQHLEYAIEDIAEQMARISRLNTQMRDALTDQRGVNKYLLMARTSDIGEALAIMDKTLDRIERREGPPTNGASPAELSREWVGIVAKLIERETPYDVLAVIVSDKMEQLP